MVVATPVGEGFDVVSQQPFYTGGPRTGHDAFRPIPPDAGAYDGIAPAKQAVLPTDAKARKAQPIARGVLDYFPLALAAIAEVSRVGNEQHNPGQPMHWAKSKSTDHADCIVRHLIDRGTFDTDGLRHSAKVAWRALALLETELEAAAFTHPTA